MSIYLSIHPSIHPSNSPSITLINYIYKQIYIYNFKCIYYIYTYMCLNYPTLPTYQSLHPHGSLFV